MEIVPLLILNSTLILLAFSLEFEGERDALRLERLRLDAEASHNAAMGPAKVALADAEASLRKVSYLEEEQEELLGRIAALEALTASDQAAWLAASLEADRGTVRVLEATRAGGMVVARERRRLTIKGAATWVEATAAATVVEGARLSSELKERGKAVEAVLQRCKATALEQSQLRQELELCDGAGAAMAGRVRAAERRARELRASPARVGLARSGQEDDTSLRSVHESGEGPWHPEALRAARERQEGGAARLQRLRAARAEVDATLQLAVSALSTCLADGAAADHGRAASALASASSVSSASPAREWSFSEAPPASFEELSPRDQAAFARAALRRLHAYRQRLRSTPAPTPQLSSDQHLAAAALLQAPAARGLAGAWGEAFADSLLASGRSSDESPLAGSSFGEAPATGAFAPLLPPLAPPLAPRPNGFEPTRASGRRWGGSAWREAKSLKEAPLRRLEYSLTPAGEKQRAKQGGRPFRASGSLASTATTAAPSSATYHGGSVSSQLASPLSSQVF